MIRVPKPKVNISSRQVIDLLHKNVNARMIQSRPSADPGHGRAGPAGPGGVRGTVAGRSRAAGPGSRFSHVVPAAVLVRRPHLPGRPQAESGRGSRWCPRRVARLRSRGSARPGPTDGCSRAPGVLRASRAQLRAFSFKLAGRSGPSRCSERMGLSAARAAVTVRAAPCRECRGQPIMASPVGNGQLLERRRSLASHG